MYQFSQKFILDVWKSFDHLKDEKFDARTFFLLHGKIRVTDLQPVVIF